MSRKGLLTVCALGVLACLAIAASAWRASAQSGDDAILCTLHPPTGTHVCTESLVAAERFRQDRPNGEQCFYTIKTKTGNVANGNLIFASVPTKCPNNKTITQAKGGGKTCQADITPEVELAEFVEPGSATLSFSRPGDTIVSVVTLIPPDTVRPDPIVFEIDSLEVDVTFVEIAGDIVTLNVTSFEEQATNAEASYVANMKGSAAGQLDLSTGQLNIPSIALTIDVTDTIGQFSIDVDQFIQSDVNLAANSVSIDCVAVAASPAVGGASLADDLALPAAGSGPSTLMWLVAGVIAATVALGGVWYARRRWQR